MGRSGILNTSMREAASRNRHPTDLLFLFYPSLFCEMTGSAPIPFPYGSGRIPVYGLFAKTKITVCGHCGCSQRKTSKEYFRDSFSPFAVAGKTTVLPFQMRLRRSAAVCKKPFKDCSKTVHKPRCTVRYTKDVDKGNRNPASTDSQPIFYFSFTPLFSIL